MSAQQTAPKWLENAVIEGLQTLLILRLKNSPAIDTINTLLDVWLMVFMGNAHWDEKRDSPRIRTAFTRIAGTVDAWPSPAQVLRELPRLPVLPSIEPPINTVSPEQARANLARIRAMLNKRFTAPLMKE